jgi:Effector-associated domain 1
MHFPELNYKELQDALVQAFNEVELTQLVRFALDEDLDSIVSKGNLSERTFNLIAWAKRQGRVEKMLFGALSRNPFNPKLRALLAVPASNPVWNHRMEVVPSIWTAKWKVDNEKQINETMQINSWTGENKFEGYGFSSHGTESQPKIYNYSFSGSIEPVGVILLEYRAEEYPVAGAKNIGVAILQISDERNFAGFFAGYRDQRDREQVERDQMTHPEESLESGKFYIPLGRMSYYGGTVEMVRSGRGK